MCVWETAALPEKLRAGLDVLDDVWVPSRFVQSALARHSDSEPRLVPHAVEVNSYDRHSREANGFDNDDFIVHFAFDANSTVARKNPVGAIRAFRRAFPRDPRSRLVIKIRNAAQVTWLARTGCEDSRAFLRESVAEDRIRILTADMAREQALGLIAMSNCYLSMHRSEGFGYTMAEAMALGTPVVATGYSGNLDFMDEGNSWLVPFEMRQLRPNQYFHWVEGMSWAQPDVAAAAASLVQIRDGSDDVERRVDKARRRLEGYTLRQMAANYGAALGTPSIERSGEGAQHQ